MERTIEARPWRPQDLIDSLQALIDAEPDRYLNDRRTTLCMARDYLKEYFSLPQPAGWVSVEDRLPDAPGHYLICTSINYWHGGCLDKNEGHKYGRKCGTPEGYEGTTMSVLDCYFDSTQDWNRVCNCHVTHWMPLPAPPEGER